MTIRTISNTKNTESLRVTHWLRIGLQAAAGAILAVLLVQLVILSIRPELAAFKPLDSYARSALFTFIPVMGATGIFAWLVKKKDQPVKKFLCISTISLLASFAPDYLLPIANKTLAASTAAAFLHLVAGIVTVSLILFGYSRSSMSRNS